MGNPPWACLRKKDLGWDRGVESKKVVQHVYLVGAKSIYRVAEKDKEYLRDEEEKNQNTACGASCWRRGSLHPNASQVFGSRPFVIHRQVQGIDLEPQECIRFLPLL